MIFVTATYDIFIRCDDSLCRFQGVYDAVQGKIICFVALAKLLNIKNSRSERKE